MMITWDDVVLAYEENFACLEDARRHYDEVAGSFFNELTRVFEFRRSALELPEGFSSSVVTVASPTAGDEKRFGQRLICTYTFREMLGVTVEARLATPAGGPPRRWWIAVSKSRYSLRPSFAGSPPGLQWLASGQSNGLSPAMTANGYLWCCELPIPSDAESANAAFDKAFDCASGLFADISDEIRALAKLYKAVESAYAKCSDPRLTLSRNPFSKMDGWWLSLKGSAGPDVGGGFYIDPVRVRLLVILQNATLDAQNACRALTEELGLQAGSEVSRHSSFELLDKAAILALTSSEVERRISAAIGTFVTAATELRS